MLRALIIASFDSEFLGQKTHIMSDCTHETTSKTHLYAVEPLIKDNNNKNAVSNDDFLILFQPLRRGHLPIKDKNYCMDPRCPLY